MNMQYWPLFVLFTLGIFMLLQPKLLWRIENIFTVKDGEPTDLYLAAMRLGGIFFIIATLGVTIYLWVR